MPPVIRPFNPPVAAPNPTPARSPLSAEARQAQRAFFQQAAGVPATTQPAAVVAPVRVAPSQAIEPAVTRVRTQPIPDEKPTGYRRPGSFIDIKV